MDYKPEGFINIAKFASDSLNYDYASLDVFECYFNKYNFDYDSLHKVDLCKMSKNDRKDALLYLRKALKQKVQEAKYYSSLNKPNCND